ncbi:hypothetical protein N866_07175 [Actinotalea ferrariae CF5-4]|uniref:Tail protein n=1 Tax=Actinotalea ferrariae CF5-4 TaxID=948458 RepID=A0A021VXA0_9CELL|nr:hypothetical protein [Actinotalea ferrariae]EYR64650.1 hypothetical protein N866_07175 [Actinotalea ferrariae CF5-4]
MTGTVRTVLRDGEGAASLNVTTDKLRRISPELRRALRPRLRAAGQITLAQAQANASWSRRIPRALSLQVSFAARNPGVAIVADASSAPHARPLEGILRDPFRHPVFGRDDVPWVTQATRPFLRPAARSTGAQVVDEVSRAIDDALTASGLNH